VRDLVHGRLSHADRMHLPAPADRLPAPGWDELSAGSVTSALRLGVDRLIGLLHTVAAKTTSRRCCGTSLVGPSMQPPTWVLARTPNLAGGVR